MKNKTNNQKKEILFIGLALFATYFGAGNLIFPPFLGLQSGDKFLPAIIGLTISGILLPIIAMVVIEKRGSVSNITKHIHNKFYEVIIGAIMLIVIFIANPRTAATAIEMGIKGVIPSVPYMPAVIIYFIIVYLLSSNQDNAFDKIGKLLTPVLVVTLLIVIIRGIIIPIGDPQPTNLSSPFANAFVGGYQTGDVLVSFLLASVFFQTIEKKGFVNNERRKTLRIAAVIAFVLLSIVYGGLLFIGACGTNFFSQNIGRAELLVGLIKKIGGNLAMTALGVSTVLACLTTATAQATAATDFFVELSGGKWNYRITLIGVTILSMLIALIGVDKIVAFSNPIYGTVYPIVLAVLVLGIFKNIIPNDGFFKGAVIFTFIYSLSESLLASGIGQNVLRNFVNLMPLNEQGFGWILPFIVGGIIGMFILKSKSRE